MEQLLGGLRELICWLQVLDSDLYQWDWMDEWSPVGPGLCFEPWRWELQRRGGVLLWQKKMRATWKKAPSLTPGLLLSLFTQQIDPLCSFRPPSKPLHSSAQLYLLHYALLIIQVYRTNKAICPVSTCLAGGLKRTAPSHHSGSLDIHHQNRRLHCLCTPVCMVNTAALSKLPALADVSDCTPQLSPCESARPLPPPPPQLRCVADKLLTAIQREENHYFKSVWLFVRVAQDRRAEDGKAQAVLIDLRSPLISLTGS